MLKQFSRCATRHALLTIAAVTSLSLGVTACGVKGPLVPPAKSDADAATAPAATPASPPLIKDPAQPERRP